MTLPPRLRRLLRALLPTRQIDRAIESAAPWLRSSDPTTYLALERLVSRYHGQPSLEPSQRDCLTRYELKVFSQNGEDGVIAELLCRLGVEQRWFVEFGVQDGREGNCVFLADVLGWSGLFIEADDQKFANLQRKYAANGAVRTRKATVTPENVEQLFAEAGVPGEPDVVSIDIDGNDYWVWERIERYRPRLVVIEYNAHWPAEELWVQPFDPYRSWQSSDNFGASLGALCALGERKGYRLVHTDLTGTNAFFVRGDLPAVLPVAEVVPRRAPNYFLRGKSYPPHRGDTPPILDLARPPGAQKPG